MSKLTDCSGADCSSELETRNWRKSKKIVRESLKIHNGRSKKEIIVENNPEQEDVFVESVFLTRILMTVWGSLHGILWYRTDA